MAQHLRYPANDGSPPDLPPSESHLFRTAAGEKRFAALKDMLCQSHLTLEFEAKAGQYELVERVSGRRLKDVARLCVTYVRSGRPKLASIARVVNKKIYPR